MSSTNRGGKREVSDYYVTPRSEIVRFLNAWDRVSFIKQARILDPCAGGDTVHVMSYPAVLHSLYGVKCDTIDIRLDSRADKKADYLKTRITTDPMAFGPAIGYDLIITNPPFALAQEICTKALDDVRPGGYVVMLLRLNFLGSLRRRSFWNTFRPQAIYVHSKRLSFTPDGKTDSIEYMHVVWQKGHESFPALDGYSSHQCTIEVI